MANLNKVMLIANLTRDVELRYTPNNMAIAKIGLAVNDSYTNKDGQKKETVMFIDAVAFAKSAEILNQYLSRGDPLFVEARLKLDSWEDKSTGQKRSKHELVIDNFQFLGGKDKSEQGGTRPASRPARTAAPQQDDEPFDDDNASKFDPESIPF